MYKDSKHSLGNIMKKSKLFTLKICTDKLFLYIRRGIDVCSITYESKNSKRNYRCKYNERIDFFIFKICIDELFLYIVEILMFFQSCLIIRKLNIKFEISSKKYKYFQIFIF